MYPGSGRANPNGRVGTPALVDDEVMGVVELGLFDGLAARERELLVRVSESLAIAIRTAKDRTRLEELLEETQRQAEELQAQQEELRVSNEELEEQSQRAARSRRPASRRSRPSSSRPTRSSKSRPQLLEAAEATTWRARRRR